MNESILIVGCGYLGTELVCQLRDQGIFSIGLRRSKVQDAQFKCLQVDVTNIGSLKSVSNLTPQIIVYCVSADAQTDESYRQHYVDGLRNILNIFNSSSTLKHIFFVSSTRVYGQSTENFVNENTAPHPIDFGGFRLLEAERFLSQARQFGTYTSLRLTGLYGPGRTGMLKLATNPSAWPKHNIWTNRIHRDDAAGFIAHLIARLISGERLEECYIVSDSCPVDQHQVLLWLAKKKGIFLETVTKKILGGKRISNQQMLGTGFVLKHSDYKSGYSAIIDGA